MFFTEIHKESYLILINMIPYGLFLWLLFIENVFIIYKYYILSKLK